MRLVLFLLISVPLFSQRKKLDTVFCDCSHAKELVVNNKTIYGKTIIPKGFGELQEISTTKQSTIYAFEKEHNTAWYKLVMNDSGELTFHVIPTKADDDYDFMLFKSGKTNFCDSLQKHKISPLRACVSRGKKELQGKTGLNFSSNQKLVKYGIGEAYCEAITVKIGEIYYLVLDNVYKNGDGHILELEICQRVNFDGIITDENNKPIKAEIALTNQKGDTISVEQSKNDGSYHFKAALIKNQSYNLNFYNDSNFNYTKSITLSDTLQLKELKTVLPKLKKGRKNSVGSINFIPGSVQYLPQAIPALNNLVKLLNKNPCLKIVIIGHSNGRDNPSEKATIDFTKGRATTIKKYLVDRGIDGKRIEIDGKGDHEMLFELPRATAEQQEQNRRVEIMVLEF